MGLLSKLRAWIGGESGSGAEGGADSRGDADDDDPADTGDEPTGLDPNAATETRSAATDDAVDALRDVRRSQTADPPDERVDEPEGSDAGGDRDAQ